MAYPKWFDYEVASFNADNNSKINEILVNKGVDARDVINIIYDFSSYTSGGPRYLVFYRKPVQHNGHKPS